MKSSDAEALAECLRKVDIIEGKIDAIEGKVDNLEIALGKNYGVLDHLVRINENFHKQQNDDNAKIKGILDRITKDQERDRETLKRVEQATFGKSDETT